MCLRLNIVFVAIPKKWEYPEDLEEGLFPNHHDIQVIINYNENKAIVFYCDNEYEFSFDDYWIFSRGKLINDEIIMVGDEDV